jgi:hypothetical protein
MAKGKIEIPFEKENRHLPLYVVLNSTEKANITVAKIVKVIIPISNQTKKNHHSFQNGR